MLVELIRFVFILAGAISGYQAALAFGWPGFNTYKQLAIIIYMILGSAVGYVAGGIIGRRLKKTFDWIEDSLQDLPLMGLIMGVIGLAAGLLISFLATLPFSLIEISILRLFLTIFVYAIFSSLGLRIGIKRQDDFKQAIGEGQSGSIINPRQIKDKLLDTNIIIDGRIVDVVRSGFLEGKMVLPRFVLRELHAVADSQDSLKRNRGRRGLDILNAFKEEFGRKIKITESDYPDIKGVDAKLVRLAQDTDAVIVTNDYNLNKVAQLEGVSVLNLNELIGALRPVVLPGEEMSVRIVKDGKEPGQGIGYLDDGTMVVVEDGNGHIGQNVELSVTGVLQTQAGKMIFTKMKAPELA